MLVKRGIACVQLAHATRQPIEVQLLAETAPVVLLVCSVRMHATICFLFWSSLCVCLYVLMLYSNTLVSCSDCKHAQGPNSLCMSAHWLGTQL